MCSEPTFEVLKIFGFPLHSCSLLPHWIWASQLEGHRMSKRHCCHHLSKAQSTFSRPSMPKRAGQAHRTPSLCINRLWLCRIAFQAGWLSSLGGSAGLDTTGKRMREFVFSSPFLHHPASYLIPSLSFLSIRQVNWFLGSITFLI